MVANHNFVHCISLHMILSRAGRITDWYQAEEMNRRALEWKEKALGNERPDTQMSVSNLVYLLHQREQSVHRATKVHDW